MPKYQNVKMILHYDKITTMEFPQKHTISECEINRRKRAFSSLILALFLSVALALKILLDLPFLEFFLSMTVFSALLLISRLLMEKAFNSFSKINIVLTDQYVERITLKGNEKINYRDIHSIAIKKTIHEKIREIKLVAKDKQIYLNGIEDIDKLYKTLKKFVNQEIKITQRREWIDFNSKYFYPIFGLLVGSGAIFLVNSLINADIQFIRGALSSFMVFVIGLGVYFVLTKPISKSHGLRFRVVDIVIGIIFLLLGLRLLFFNLY